MTNYTGRHPTQVMNRSFSPVVNRNIIEYVNIFQAFLKERGGIRKSLRVVSNLNQFASFDIVFFYYCSGRKTSNFEGRGKS